MSGWIKLHRKLIDSPVFDNDKLLRVWVWCLLRASHKERTVLVGLQEVTLNPGEFIFGRDSAAQQLKLPPSTVYRLMKKLEDPLGNLVIKASSKYSVISIVNWGNY